MSKGSKRRPGKGYEDNWDRIFGKTFTLTELDPGENIILPAILPIEKNHTQEYVIKNTPESV